MYELDVMLGLLMVAFVLLIVGYAARDKGWGAAMIGLGIVGAMSVLAYKMYLTFG
ncbi:hypothetical protein N8H22_10130 [Stutzerimonas stutzeri]|uniref:hypothetical protein n=1 Tax=Stutzerimonas sp. S1 TaxID=3030652 RepID=UPI00222505B0|nr:hypothetical protein [Stutzerimonas sp. S1]MCW3148949.1 hypothetical protein [Stutzerimonas sp. S1]